MARGREGRGADCGATAARVRPGMREGGKGRGFPGIGASPLAIPGPVLAGGAPRADPR